MTYLVDTDWVASFLNGRTDAQHLFGILTFEEMAISLITYGELLDGIYYGRNPQQSEAIFRTFLRGVVVPPLNKPIMERFALIRGDLRRRGQLIGDPDLLIAATALYHHLTLVTHNTRHFQRIPGLMLY